MTADELVELIESRHLDERTQKQLKDIVTENIRLKDDKIQLYTRIRDLMQSQSELHKRRTDLEQKLEHNAISGLPNHKKLDKDISPLLNDFLTFNPIPVVAFMIIKLDELFDEQSRILDNPVTEWLIFQTAERIKKSMGEYIPLYHTREKEFIAIMFDNVHEQDLEVLAESLGRSIKKPHQFNNHTFAFSCHIGISIYPEHGLNKKFILSHADMALENARDNKRIFAFYDDTMREKAANRLEFQNILLKSFDSKTMEEIDKQFELFFQPIQTLEREDDGYVITDLYAETLMRWNHPRRGSILPLDFIETAEKTGLIIPMGRWVFQKAVEHLHNWKDSFGDKRKLSINISPRQFYDNQFMEQIAEAVESGRIEPQGVIIEVTESCLFFNIDDAVSKMKFFCNLGFKLAIDDFGTKYSTLNYLKKFPFHFIKIDKSFTDQVLTSPVDQSLIKSILDIAASLGVETIVEGLETREQLDRLYSLGCRTFQGYYFSKPLDSNCYFNHFLSSGLV